MKNGTFNDVAAFFEPCSRRSFLKTTLLAAAILHIPRPVLSAVTTAPSSQKDCFLYIYNTHTGEFFKDVYRSRGIYLPESLEMLNRILRDYRTGEVTRIDPELFDLLHAIQSGVQTKEAYHVVSAYRTRETNEYLRKIGRKVARNSLHIAGKAVDVYLPDVALSTLRKKAVQLRSGGVGYYRRNHFVHIDTGNIRYW